jgi:hypothetical protein
MFLHCELPQCGERFRRLVAASFIKGIAMCSEPVSSRSEQARKSQQSGGDKEGDEEAELRFSGGKDREETDSDFRRVGREIMKKYKEVFEAFS